MGKDALIELTKQCSKDREWKTLDGDEQQWLLKQLITDKAKEAITTKVAYTAKDISSMLLRINPEVSKHLL